MATNSYPAVGDNGFSATQWAAMYASADSIIEDYSATGAACAMDRYNSSDVVRIYAGRVRVNGYVCEIGLETGSPGYEDLNCPPVLANQPPVTYYIGVMYDPAQNVAQQDGSRSPQGPCRLGIWTSLDTSGGKAYAPLYTLTRTYSQVISAADKKDYRRWSGPMVTVNNDYSRNYPAGFGSMPRGSMMISAVDPDANGASIWVREPNSDNTTLVWKSILNEDAVAFPATSGLVARFGPPQYYRYAGGMVGMRGTLQRANGVALTKPSYDDVLLGTMPAKSAPTDTVRFPVAAGGGYSAVVRVDGITGKVYLQPSPAAYGDIPWIDLGAIRYRAGA